MGLTKIEIDDILRRIETKEVTIPIAGSLDELRGWLNGYAMCRADVIDILEDVKETISQSGD